MILRAYIIVCLWARFLLDPVAGRSTRRRSSLAPSLSRGLASFRTMRGAPLRILYHVCSVSNAPENFAVSFGLGGKAAIGKSSRFIPPLLRYAERQWSKPIERASQRRRGREESLGDGR